MVALRGSYVELYRILDKRLGQTSRLIKRVPTTTLSGYSAFAHSDNFSLVLSALTKNWIHRKNSRLELKQEDAPG